MTLVLTSCTYAYGRQEEPVLREFGYELPDGLTVLLGPGGAGKSTLLKLAASEVAPCSGTVTFEGEPAGSAEFRRAVGWVPQGIAPLPSVSARDYVAYVGWLKGMRRRVAWTSAGEALERVGLGAQARRRTTRLAADELARLHLAACLVHEARLLLLDEPTAGLHLNERETYQNALAELTGEGDVRVLLATREVAALPALAKRKGTKKAGRAGGQGAADLAEVVGHVAALDTAQDDGATLYAGTTASFLALAPAGSARRSPAAAAYATLVSDTDGDATE